MDDKVAQTKFNKALNAKRYREQFGLDWKSIPLPEELKVDVADAEASASTFHDDIVRALNILAPTAEGSTEDRSTLAPKVARKQAEWSYPVFSEPLLSTKYLFSVTGKLLKYRPMAKMLGKVLNHQMNHQMQKVSLISKLIRRCCNEGTAILKYQWEYKEKKTKEEVTYEIDEVDAYGEVIIGSNGKPKVKRTTEIVEDVQVLTNKPKIELCKYDSVAVDPSCGDDITQATYMVHKYDVTMKDLANDPRYKNVRQAFEEAAQSATETSTYTHTNIARRRCTLIEYWGEWDIYGTGETESIVAAFIGNVLVRLSKNPYPDGRFPFVFITHTPNITPSVYGEPPSLLVEDNQKFIGTIMRGASDTFGRSAMSQFLIPEGFFSRTESENFSKGANATYRNVGIPPEHALHQVRMPDLPPAMFNMLQFLQHEVDSISGSQSFSQGITGNAMGSTAAGVNASVSATGLRDMDVLRRIVEGLTEVAYRITELNIMMLSEEELILLSGMEEEEFYAIYDPDMASIAAMTISIDVATRAYNDARSSRLAFLYQTKQSEMDAELSRDTLATILELDDLEDFSEQVRNYQPQPDPMQIALQEAELERKKVENAYIAAKMEHEYAKKDQTSAKSVTETAKASNLDAKTANENLEFKHAYDGTTQTRQKEIINEQAYARSNADLNTEGGRNLLANAQAQADREAEELTSESMLDQVSHALKAPAGDIMDLGIGGARPIDPLTNNMNPLSGE